MASAEVVITARHVVVHGGEQRGARGVGIELAGLYQRPKIVVGRAMSSGVTPKKWQIRWSAAWLG